MSRHSTRYCSGMTALLLMATALFIHGRIGVGSAQTSLAEKTVLVRALQLTDLCLFTEASYTRHLSMTDLNVPFQDSPGSFEHFPSGSLTIPPGNSSGLSPLRITVTKHGR